MVNRWTASETTVYTLNYLIVFCPKYRRPVLVGDIVSRLRELLFEKATELDVSIEEMEVMPRHVRLFVKAPPILAPHFLIGQLKGYSSRILREEFPQLKSRLPSLWTRSYYVESVGHVSEDRIRQYLEAQKGQ